MKDEVVAFIVLMLFLVFVCIGLYKVLDKMTNQNEMIAKLIVECERSLPRTETCILVAVPKPTK